MSDALLKLLFENASARGEVVTLGESFKQALAGRTYPKPVEKLAGETVAAALLARAALSYKGPALIQIVGDGPVQLITVEVSENLQYRLAILLDEESVIADDASMKDLINVNGQGRCALILVDDERPENQMPYQGIVPLTGDNFAQCMCNYFMSSEQVDTRIELASDGEHAGGVFVQKMPTMGGKELPENYDEEAWHRISTFTQTVKDEELTTLDAETVARRLFWEEEPKVIGEFAPVFHCNCSKDAVENVIRQLGEEEALEMLDDNGNFVATCRYCNTHHTFTTPDIQALFQKAKSELN